MDSFFGPGFDSPRLHQRNFFKLLTIIIKYYSEQLKEVRKTNQRKYHFIYKTTCCITGSFYIGMHSTDNLNDGYLGGGIVIEHSLKKYGRKNHKREILEYLSDRISLDAREREIVNSDLLKNPLCLNLVEGGNGGFSLSDEHIKKFSDAGHKGFRKKLDNDSSFKQKFIDLGYILNETIDKKGTRKIPDTKGIFHTEEAKKKIGTANSIKQSGENNSQFGRYWIYRGDEVLRIESVELEKYLSLGWSRGKKETMREERFWIYKNEQRKRVSSKYLEEFLMNGWIRK